MSSSSDLEILPAPSTMSKAPSPIKPRVSSRLRRAPRGRDELAAPAALAVARPSNDASEEPQTSHAPPRDGADGRGPRSVNKARSPVPRDPQPVASTSTATLPESEPLDTAKLPASSSAPSLTAAAPRPKPKKSSPAPAPLRRASSDAVPSRPPIKARSSTPKVPKKPYVKPPGGDSSDEADDFFNRAKPATTTGRIPGMASRGPAGRVPGTGRGGGRVPKAVARSSAGPTGTSPARPKQRKFAPSSSDSDSDTSKSSAAPQPTGYSSEAEPMTKDVVLPAWARGSKDARPGMSGADLAKQQKGYQRNRKRRRLSQESEDDNDDVGAGAGKGKGKQSDPLDLSDDEGDSEDGLGTPRAEARPAQNRPRRPGLQISLAGGDEDDDDDEAATSPGQRSQSRAIASGDDDGTPGATPQAAQPKPASPPKKTTAQLLLETARGLRLLSPPKSPQRTFDATTITLGSSSDDGRSDQAGSTFAAVRSTVRTSDPDLEIMGPSKARASETGTVTILLRMTTDPTAAMSEMVRKVYEKEEKFELGINESFSNLFDQLAAKRYLNRHDLIITHEKSRLYDFGTPKSLRLKPGDVVSMRGYNQQVWDRTKQLEREQKAKQARTTGSGALDDDDDDFSALERAASAMRGGSLQPPATSSTLRQSRSPSAQPRSPGEDLFRITVRGSKTQSVDLAVKLTATAQSLVKAYAKHHGITDQARVARMFIEIEGDKIEPTQTIQDIKDEFDFEGEETVDLRDPGA
ncbi:hypothetical protein JCM3766R1_000389 [Sporobolomyces carnicolor]